MGRKATPGSGVNALSAGGQTPHHGYYENRVFD